MSSTLIRGGVLPSVCGVRLEFVIASACCMGGGLVCESVGIKADLLSVILTASTPGESVDLPLTCHPSPSLTTFACKSSEVRRLFLDLDFYGGTDPLFHIFLRELLMLGPLILMLCFGGMFVWVISRLAGGRPKLTPIPKGHRPPLLPITDRFP